ncbi:MAG: DEAD/DEAH box helicase, partial [Propionibacteriaceae bacterium]|nr:DEAD/DEAH box helicase [Propionibacteriaceae bacterium]
ASLDRWLDRADQTLLTELGRAVAVWPDLAPALRQAKPSSVALDETRTFAFLTEAADRLRMNDFVVLVPNWWGKRRVGLSGFAAPVAGGPAEGMLTRDTLCMFSWRLSVGETTLDDDEILALAQSKVPLVQLRGGWVAFDQDQVRRGLAFLAKQAEGESKTVGEVIALATGMTLPDADLPIVSCEASGLLGDLLRGEAERSLKSVKVPTSFTGKLRPYQQRGVSWLAFLGALGLGACLADDMGLGKTVQLLALETYERRGRKRLLPTLLICPVSLVGNWQAEAARFAPKLRVCVHHGSARAHSDELTDAIARADLVITTYQTLLRDQEELGAVQWRRVVLDEAQAVKNAATRAAKAVRTLPSDHRVALTGTPVENRLAELRSIMDFLNPGILGSPDQFNIRFARPIESGHQAEPLQRLRAITQPFILRRVKTDKTIISDLPEKIETKQTCLLTPEQASLYAVVVDEMMQKIETSTGIERRGNVLAAMTKLKQICNHPAQFLHDGSSLRHRSGKIERLDEIVEEILAEDAKALIFTQFTEFGDMLLRHLSARFNQDVLYLHGQVPATRRQEMVREFQTDGGPSLFILSLRAGGVGLNLTGASHVIHIDRWWNPAVENQATDRAYRIGQNQRVQVHTFICKGTLEEHIDLMMEQKKELANLVIGEGEGWLTELSTEQLRSVFALSREAVDE